MKKVFSHLALLLLVLVLSACSGESTNSDTNTTPIEQNTPQLINPLTGIFVDSAVAGLNYSCSSGNSGVTNSLGEFTCESGDRVSFSLGAIFLGELEMAEIITPLMLFGGNETAALNFAQLIQTLDTDEDLSNGITIDETLLASLETLDFTSLSFDEDVQIALGNDIVLVSEAQAVAHLNETLASLNINADGTPRVEPEPEPEPEPTPTCTDAQKLVGDSCVAKTCEADGYNCPEPEPEPEPTPTPTTYSWSTGAWSSCSGSCGINNATQTRSVICVASTGGSVSDGMCTTTKPATTQACTASICPPPPPLNNAPVITSSATVSVDENNVTALTITATDSDGDTLTYSISGGDSTDFNINSSTGVVTFKVAPDYETKSSYTFTATVSDGSLSDTQSVTVNINDVAEAPTLANFTATVDENATIGTVVGNITITSTGDSNITAFALSDTTNFEVNASGHITTKTTLDYETTTVYNLEVNATNAQGTSANKTVTINVTNRGDFYIKSAVYDNNATADVADDTLYVYFDQAIETASITANSNYNINGTGAIDANSISDYNDTLFHRHRTKIAAGSTALITNDTNITIATGVITDSYAAGIARFIEGDNNETVIEAFKPVLTTGQTTTYTEFDDGNTTNGKARSYTDNADGTVTDNATGLIWQKEDDNNTKNWTNANTYCESLNLGGSSDWRLPTVDELLSITDLGRVNPAINPIFTNTNNLGYCSSTTNTRNTAQAWYVHFSDGSDNYANKTAMFYVRCVR